MKYEDLIKEKLNCIIPPSDTAKKHAREKWANCAHPLGSLGLLEDAIEDIAALSGAADVELTDRAVLVFCADNGVVAQGVSQSESNVTTNILYGLVAGSSAVCKMAETAGCKVVPIDMGVKDFKGIDGVISCRIGNGTKDFTSEAAMSREQASQAIYYGMELIKEYKEKGFKLLATGEAGIGNTTTASAVACVLLERSAKEMAGRGAGLSDEGLNRKIKAIENGILLNRPDKKDPIDVISKVGGFDIAAMCGAFLGGAVYGIPVVIDGFISSVAALCAVRLCPMAEKAMFASHVSAEPAGKLLLDALGKKPILTADMHLGEGTGAVAVIPLLDMALNVYKNSYTFDECGIEPYKPLGGF